MHGGQKERATRRGVHQCLHLLPLQTGIVQPDEGVPVLQGVPHLNGGGHTSWLALVEGVEEVQEEVVRGSVADLGEEDDPVGEGGTKFVVGQVAQQGGLAHSNRAMELTGEATSSVAIAVSTSLWRSRNPGDGRGSNITGMGRGRGGLYSWGGAMLTTPPLSVPIRSV